MQHETAPQERTAQQLSFEWSHFRISSTDSKVRTTLPDITDHEQHHGKVLISRFRILAVPRHVLVENSDSDPK